ncbi:hypothetical protein DL89DRAFT_130293 [Linderina pennispora]|uniref:Uncharacterized protein n=1 Tax=Linderina pennispora TaxID=61395 RepID=A0A1Y1WDQ1_9FUNG|nr:uncharacterized protein DL89DRAFT_130293 [Linderina pennispora]ORX71657.1 hypothetical protein DL89DRAFT_130293 [Linderina pennispora]
MDTHESSYHLSFPEPSDEESAVYAHSTAVDSSSSTLLHRNSISQTDADSLLSHPDSAASWPLANDTLRRSDRLARRIVLRSSALTLLGSFGRSPFSMATAISSRILACCCFASSGVFRWVGWVQRNVLLLIRVVCRVIQADHQFLHSILVPLLLCLGQLAHHLLALKEFDVVVPLRILFVYLGIRHLLHVHVQRLDPPLQALLSSSTAGLRAVQDV